VKKPKELRATIYKIIEEAMTAKWKKEFPDRNEIMH